MLVAPFEAAARAKVFDATLLCVERGFDECKGALQVEGARLVRQAVGLFGRQRELLRCGVVREKAAGCLVGEPLANVTLRGSRQAGKLARSEGPAFGERAIQAEL